MIHYKKKDHITSHKHSIRKTNDINLRQLLINDTKYLF